jgi:hypothetical protein
MRANSELQGAVQEERVLYDAIPMQDLERLLDCQVVYHSNSFCCSIGTPVRAVPCINVLAEVGLGAKLQNGRRVATVRRLGTILTGLTSPVESTASSLPLAATYALVAGKKATSWE